MLVIGRSQGLDEDDPDDLLARRQSRRDSHPLICITYDDLLSILRETFESYAAACRQVEASLPKQSSE